MIYIPKLKIIESEIIVPRPTIKGHFEIFKGKHPKAMKKVAAFDNLITDFGYERLFTSPGGSNAIGYCYVGSSSAAPSFGQSQLGALIGTNDVAYSPNVIVGSTETMKCSMSVGYRFNPGSATGTLSEIGVGIQRAGSSPYLFSRALILDGSGNPTTINVQAEEYLDTRYTVSLNIPGGDVTGTVNITGSGSHDFVTRTANIAYWSPQSLFNASQPTLGNVYAHTGDLGSISALPGGNASPANGGSVNTPYNPGTHVCESTTIFSLDDGVLAGGIKSVSYSWAKTYLFSYFQTKFTPNINKLSGYRLKLSFNMSLTR